MAKVVLKHLAQEFDMDPHMIRRALRDKMDRPAGRWEWEDDDPQLEEARRVIQEKSAKSK